MINELLNSINIDNLKKIDTANKKFEITKILAENDGKPVLINNVNGYKVIGNLCNRDIIAKSLGVNKENLVEYMIDKLDNEKNGQLIIDNSLKEQYVEDNLSEINNYPIPTYYEKDAGPYLTSAIVIVKDKDYGVNSSIHRILIRKDGTLVIRMVEQRHLHYIYNKNIKNNNDGVDVAIVIGVHPALLLASSTSGDITFNELKYGASLMGEPLKLIKCDTVDLEVPAGEFIIEGKITTEFAEEGPFVDITGTYDTIRQQPVIKITKLLRKKEPIFHALLPGGIEHKILMGLPQEPRMYKGIRNTVPSVKQVALTEGGCCWLHAVVSIDKKTEGDGKNAILAALASHPSLKHVVIVDGDIDIHNPNDVEFAIATRVQGDKDIIIIPNAKGSSLDPSGDHKNKLTTKIGIDATISLLKNKEEYIRAKIPDIK